MTHTATRPAPRTAWAAAAVLAAATLLAGCAGERPPAAVPLEPGSMQTAVDCAAEPDAGWGGIPADFEVVAVYVCDPVMQLELPTPMEGEDPVPEVSSDPQRLEGDFTPVLRAFEEPSDPPWPGPCTADMVIVPDVWLVDADGRAIRPAYPATGCGKPKPGVEEALALLVPVE